MTAQEIAYQRLANQQVSSPAFPSPAKVVAWMGAMQAQDFDMSKWAIGVRQSSPSLESINKAIDNGEILRTHVLRPTWHFVSSKDIRWMIELSAPQIITSMKSRENQLGLTSAMIRKSNRVITNLLNGGNHCTREELVKALDKEKLRNEDNRAAHLIGHAELMCLICSGKQKNGKHTYAMMDERVPSQTSVTRESAVLKLAETYFKSHGPASLHDFLWWSGLPMKEVRHAIEELLPKLTTSMLEGEKLFAFRKQRESEETFMHLLPSFDEYLISYKSRHISLPKEKTEVAISMNGIFKPVIVVNGRIAGLWKRTRIRGSIKVESQFFQKPSKEVKEAFEREVAGFVKFGS